MKKDLLAGIAMLFLVTGTAHAGIDVKRGRCETSDHVRYPCSLVYGKNWRKIFKDWMKNNPDLWWYALPPSPAEEK